MPTVRQAWTGGATVAVLATAWAWPSAAQEPALDPAWTKGEMAALKVDAADADAFLREVPAFFRWAERRVPVAFVAAADFDPACRAKVLEMFAAAASELEKSSGQRFEVEAEPAKARMVFEFSPAAQGDPRVAAELAKPGAFQSWRNPGQYGALRQDIRQFSSRQSKTVEFAYVWDSAYHAANRTRPGIAAPCAPYDFPWLLVHLSMKLEIAPLNYAIGRNYDPESLRRFDRFVFSLVYASGLAPGAPGAEVADRLRAALR